MVHTTTQQRPEAETDERVAPPPAGPSRAARLSALTGALGVVAAVLPLIGLVSLVLATTALVAGTAVMRQGPDAPEFATARLGAVFGMIGVIVGTISLGMQLFSLA